MVIVDACCSQALEEPPAQDQTFFVTDSAEFDAFPAIVEEEEPQPDPLPPLLLDDDGDCLAVEEDPVLQIAVDNVADHLVEGFADGIEEETDISDPSAACDVAAVPLPTVKQNKVPKSGVFYKDGQDLDKCFVANSARRVGKRSFNLHGITDLVCCLAQAEIRKAKKNSSPSSSSKKT